MVTKTIKKIKSLCILFPKMITFRSFDKTNCTYLLINEENINETGKYNEIFEKVSNLIK